MKKDTVRVSHYVLASVNNLGVMLNDHHWISIFTTPSLSTQPNMRTHPDSPRQRNERNTVQVSQRAAESQQSRGGAQ